LHALDSILKTGKVNIHLLISTLVILLMMLFSPYLLAGGEIIGAIDSTILLMVTCFLMVYTVLMIALGSDRFRVTAQWGLLLVVCVELASFSWQTVNDRDVLTVKEFRAKTGYNDYSNEAVAWIKLSDPGFYRIEKTYGSGPAMHGSINDAKIQGYFGATSYHSFNQLNYIRFLDALGVIDGNKESATRWASGIINNPLLTSFAAVKYVLVKQKDFVQKFTGLGYRLVRREGDVFVMLNPSYLPFGFTYDSYIAKDEFLSLPTPSKSVALMKTAVVEQQLDQAGLPQMTHFNQTLIEPAYTMESYMSDVNQRRSSVLSINHFDNNHVKGEIKLDRPKMLFFTLPFDPGWSVAVNGQPAELSRVNIGFSGLWLPAGEHTIELRYHLPHFKASLIVSILSIICLMILLWRSRGKAKLAHPLEC
jgi:uncharacterized membrane protein YfhO